MPNKTVVSGSRRRPREYVEGFRVWMPRGWTYRIHAAASARDVSMQEWVRSSLSVALTSSEESEGE